MVDRVSKEKLKSRTREGPLKSKVYRPCRVWNVRGTKLAEMKYWKNRRGKIRWCRYRCEFEIRVDFNMEPLELVGSEITVQRLKL